MLNRYMNAVRLLDEIGPWSSRLESVYHMVKDPTFLYVKNPAATYLLATLATSSYWLDTELFNENVIQKDLADKTLNAEQKAHILLLDIGSTLIDKDFPLKQEMIGVFCRKNSPLYSYVKTFLSQCHKRNEWTKQAIVCKKIRSLHHQKENVR